MKTIDLKQVRNEYIKKFKNKNIDCFDVDYIISQVLNISTTEVILTKTINKKHFCKLKKIFKKRLKGYPCTLIFKKAYFYANEFFVNKHVLSCRQDTEILIEQIEKLNNKNFKILDLCTGSGCIGITLNKLGYNQVVASDISRKALKIAKINNKKLKTDVKFIKSDLFNSIHDKYDVIVCNPPYIETQTIKGLDDEVKNFDPIIALDGGVDGLKFYREIISQLNRHLTENGIIIFEIGYNQSKQVSNLLKNHGFESKVIKDYSGNDRVVIGNKIDKVIKC